MLRVVRGEPTDEELAALIGALTRDPASCAGSRVPRSAWSNRASQLRSNQFHAGPNAWSSPPPQVRGDFDPAWRLMQ